VSTADNGGSNDNCSTELFSLYPSQSKQATIRENVSLTRWGSAINAKSNLRNMRLEELRTTDSKLLEIRYPQ